MKRRQLYRRVTIIVVVVAVLLVLILGFYFAYSQANLNATYVNQPIASSDYATLRQLSAAPYGPPGASLLSDVKNSSASPFTSNGRPLLVYIGADYCPFCAIQRWPLVIALLRFGNFTNLQTMASSSSEGDYITFTFHGSSYTSKYLVFQGFEQEDRNTQPLDSVPSNYTGVFSQFGSSYPFLNFGNRYIISGSMIAPETLAGKEGLTPVFNDISSSDSLGTQIREAANVITALICKITSNAPSSVCNQSPIGGSSGLTQLIAAYVPGSLGLAEPAWVAGTTISPWYSLYAVNKRG
jgi:hypothetical protein